MTFEQLPQYCERYMHCSDCPHKGLCTRFFNKYGDLPVEFRIKGLPEQKYKVTVDCGWGIRIYREYYISAKTAGKATYKVAKLMGLYGVQFQLFLEVYSPITERIPLDSDAGFYYEYVETDCYSNEYKRTKYNFDNEEESE